MAGRALIERRAHLNLARNLGRPWRAGQPTTEIHDDASARFAFLSIATQDDRLMLRSVIARFAAFVDHPDGRVRVANKAALVVASNLPFYPLYVHWIVGKAGWPAWFALLTAPGFAAVPALARRHALAGRALLPLVGVANTVLCTKVLGAATGVELFLLPCVLLAALLFGSHERVVALLTAALPFVCYLLLDKHLGAPLQRFSDADYAALIALNGVSVASLTALIGYLFATVAEADRSRDDSFR